jgi:hypothetical protein
MVVMKIGLMMLVMIIPCTYVFSVLLVNLIYKKPLGEGSEKPMG